ncbi:LicD-like protein [Metarhizium robertsii ARSEF 23]|uniref:LicD-like protein n=1 Tax=Metarhizium robertsii (strain ARSEF 23 / ATCC MYA-3075) TaxID=655844 RepID=E9FE67_METRA|nr:LicD-like protein [Metarhizium robertsii ARSEF 23]EFY93972.1 LicD-like protein [Metarhizium robertsii ARSEF 23]
MGSSRVLLALRLCSAACVVMVLTSGYILFQSPVFVEVTESFPIPTPIPAEGIERNAHKNLGSGSTKYYTEPGGSYELMHYDTRYFQKELAADERRTVLEDLIRSYLNVTNHYEIETWLAHGTLMGWWWGGRIMPWDSDIDVQLSFETLDSIAPELNFTEFRYEMRHADGQLVSKSYLLDINPYYGEAGPIFDTGQGSERHGTLAERGFELHSMLAEVLGAFRPGGICASLRIRPREVIVILGVDVMIVILRLVYLSKKAVQGRKPVSKGRLPPFGK